MYIYISIYRYICIHKRLIHKEHARTHAKGADPRVWGLARAGLRVAQSPMYVYNLSVCVLCGSPVWPAPPVVGPLWGPPLCVGPLGGSPVGVSRRAAFHVASTRVMSPARSHAPAYN